MGAVVGACVLWSAFSETEREMAVSSHVKPSVYWDIK